MSWSSLIRQTHRWLSIILVVAVVINITALAMKSQAFWIGLLALIPLIFMIITGLYLFVLPYLPKGRGQRAAG